MLTTITGLVATLLTIVTTIAGGVLWLWRQVRRKLVEPVTAVAVDLSTVKDQVRIIEHEIRPNGGGSMNDAQRRTENAVDRLERSVVAVHRTLTDERDERRAADQSLTDRFDAHIDRN